MLILLDDQVAFFIYILTFKTYLHQIALFKIDHEHTFQRTLFFSRSTRTLIF